MAVSAVPLPAQLLRELREKYAEMLAMRMAEHRDDRPDEPQVRARMAALAARFPGALREIDAIELAEIRRRIALLDDLASGRQPAEPWVEATALYHRFARGALAAKRWLGGRRGVTSSLAKDFERAAAGLPYGQEALEWRAELAVVASPPHGRLTRAVCLRVASVLGISETEVRSRVLVRSGGAGGGRGSGSRR